MRVHKQGSTLVPRREKNVAEELGTKHFGTHAASSQSLAFLSLLLLLRESSFWKRGLSLFRLSPSAPSSSSQPFPSLMFQLRIPSFHHRHPLESPSLWPPLVSSQPQPQCLELFGLSSSYALSSRPPVLLLHSQHHHQQPMVLRVLVLLSLMLLPSPLLALRSRCHCILYVSHVRAAPSSACPLRLDPASSETSAWTCTPSNCSSLSWLPIGFLKMSPLVSSCCMCCTCCSHQWWKQQCRKSRLEPQHLSSRVFRPLMFLKSTALVLLLLDFVCKFFLPL
mmetsp:Transcript_28948/g.46534  ORF Transcript_28948/g.46534 Transcript_28948/m.46534 type:complete len:280 (+) Transcript_28948:10552-11391(+)